MLERAPAKSQRNRALKVGLNRGAGEPIRFQARVHDHPQIMTRLERPHLRRQPAVPSDQSFTGRG